MPWFPKVIDEFKESSSPDDFIKIFSLEWSNVLISTFEFSSLAQSIIGWRDAIAFRVSKMAHGPFVYLMKDLEMATLGIED